MSGIPSGGPPEGWSRHALEVEAQTAKPPPAPPGVPLSAVRLSGVVSVGAIIQAVTVLLSVAGSVFAAGAYMQSLKDEIIQTRRQQEGADDAIVAKLQALIQTADTAVSKAQTKAPTAAGSGAEAAPRQ